MLLTKLQRNFSFKILNSLKYSSKDVTQRIKPKCIYVQPPVQWIKNKINFQKLKFYDKSFNEKDFIKGSKMALLVTLDLIRMNNSVELARVTTLRGFSQISRYIRTLQKESKTDYLCFDDDDICNIITSNVEMFESEAECDCFVEVLFMGMKFLKDILAENQNINLKLMKNAEINLIPMSEQLLFIEGYIKLHSSYTQDNLASDWKIDHFKFSEFNIVRNKTEKQ
ncbi:hypothetical protein PVAND_007786 [Polypedilum vanderplanki]|uniref:Uncharacterized protein n=1 Tax=Polypedilum vanderplanki TaxID=319348 RepID=A0A9J6C7E9_POLVA|nr:hypothetical protein PVAND_007786 [Polypedilum vanderplanki]